MLDWQANLGNMMQIQKLKTGSRQLAAIVIFLLLPLMVVRCSHKETTAEDPDALFSEAEEAFKDERYLIAVERYRDIKNRFPYSARATDAELRIADAYFEQESYLEAESAYEIFKELHPSHPKSAYVQYRIAMSFFYQIPANASRDLSAAYKAIESFTTLMERYPTSEYGAKGKEYIQESRKRLAEHDAYVADFYYQREHYLSASYRYSELLREFPALGFDEEALFRLGRSYFNIRMYANAKDALVRLLTQFPETGFKGDGQNLMSEIDKKTGK